MKTYNIYTPIILVLTLCFSTNIYTFGQVTDTFEIDRFALVRAVNGIMDEREIKNDSYIMAHANTNNFRNIPSKYDKRNVIITRTYFDFDLSDIPADAEIIKATLHLKTDYIAPWWIDGHRKPSENITIIHKIQQEWDEETINWANQPYFSEEQTIALPESLRKYQDYSIDMTALISESIKVPDEHHGFLLKLKNERPYRRLIFASHKHESEKLHPKLLVQYQHNGSRPDNK